MHNYAVQRPNVSIDGSSDIDLHVTTDDTVSHGLGLMPGFPLPAALITVPIHPKLI